MTEHPVIHRAIAAAGYRFIYIHPASKLPAESKWNAKNNYAADDPQIRFWLRHPHSYERPEKGTDYYVNYEGFGNYGVLCDESHIVLDIDEDPELVATVQKAIDDGLLPRTLVITSGSGKGVHLYYRTDRASTSIPLTHPVTKVNSGHVKGPGGYAVGPGSIHDKTRQPYIVKHDRDIAFVPFDTLLKILGKYITKKEPPVTAAHHTNYNRLSINIPIASVCYPDKAVDRGNGEIQGAHSLHGSTGGSNFSINTAKNVFRCWRHGSGGGVLEWIGIEHGIIDCSDAHPGCLRGQKFLDVLDIIEEMGYDVRRPVRKALPSPKILDKEPVLLDELPENLPSTEIAVLDGHPRIGKSYWGIRQGLKQYRTTFIAATHTVLEHQIGIFRKLRTPDQTAVHFGGKADIKTKMCRTQFHGNCKDGCPMYPFDDNRNYPVFKGESINLLYEKGVLTADDVPTGRCPYWTIRMAEPDARYCFAPVAAYDEVDIRDFEVFDEDTTIDYFYPSSVDLAELTTAFGFCIKSKLNKDWRGIKRFEKYLQDDSNRPRGKKVMKTCIRILTEIHNILKVKNLNEDTKHQILEKLNAINTTITIPDGLDRTDILKKIKEHEYPKESVSKYAEALLFPYKRMQFEWQGWNPAILRMIADESIPIRKLHPCKTLIIGSTQALMFAKAQKKSTTHLKIEKFPYADAFLFVAIQRPGEPDGTSYKALIGQTLLRLFESRFNSNERIPALVITGNKREQEKVKKRMPGVGWATSIDTEESLRNWHSGDTVIFYQNSSLARGLDAPQYSITIHYGSNFASPYWMARLSVAYDERNWDEVDKVQEIIDVIDSDELTNSVLRMSPISSDENMSGNPIKLVFIDEDSTWKIKHSLANQIPTAFITPEVLHNLVKFTPEPIGQSRNLFLSRTVQYQAGSENIRGKGKFEILKKCISHARSKNVGEFQTRKKIIEILNTLSVATLSDYLKKVNPELVASVERLMNAEIFRLNKFNKSPRYQAMCRWGARRRKEYTMELIAEVLHKMIRNGVLIRLPDDKLAVRDRNLQKVTADQTDLPPLEKGD